MSNSEGIAFERWIVRTFEETGGFTALILLMSIGETKVAPISCSFVHVIGRDVAWADMRQMLDQSRRRWEGVAIFAETAPGGGPLAEIVAKARLQERIDEVTMNRMALNTSGFFDTKGRAIRIDPLEEG